MDLVGGLLMVRQVVYKARDRNMFTLYVLLMTGRWGWGLYMIPKINVPETTLEWFWAAIVGALTLEVVAYLGYQCCHYQRRDTSRVYQYASQEDFDDELLRTPPSGGGRVYE